MKKVWYSILALCSLTLTACSTITPMPSYRYIEEKPQPDFETPTLDIPVATWTKETLDYDHKLRIYIDGDAQTTGLFSKTPSVPYSMKDIAAEDPYPFSAVLGRPCYYIEDTKCVPNVWEDGRFLPEILAQMTIVLERWQKRYHPSEIELIGYDGGAAIALLLATRIKHTPVTVITFGGILDTDRQAALEGKDLPPNSLNPAKETFKLANIPQIHYVGGQDTIATKRLAEDFIKQISSPKSIQLRLIPYATHTNWHKFMGKLLNQPAPQVKQAPTPQPEEQPAQL